VQTPARSGWGWVGGGADSVFVVTGGRGGGLVMTQAAFLLHFKRESVESNFVTGGGMVVVG